ncbi:D-glycero-beta-D-manno-heptose 1,7-bisphosphate 7-phosphatase [Candidatus Pseudothioglobus singularis]|nr:D-glycero-beta-D-manno-heptose 1,7-bisphosphate 7-phosphatase [Candidatus Pseudothioglobus singularis]
MAIKTIFLDRDGVINKEVGYLHRVEDFIFIDGVFEACVSFKKLDYQIIIISNQSGIARGYFKLFEYENLTKWMLNQFSKKNISILDVFFCPHGPKSKCDCRKPRPGMIIDAMKKYNINLEKSWMIGDKETDIEAANLAGISNTILLRSGHKINESDSKSKYIIDSIKDSINLINN